MGEEVVGDAQPCLLKKKKNPFLGWDGGTLVSLIFL